MTVPPGPWRPLSRVRAHQQLTNRFQIYLAESRQEMNISSNPLLDKEGQANPDKPIRPDIVSAMSVYLCLISRHKQSLRSWQIFLLSSKLRSWDKYKYIDCGYFARNNEGSGLILYQGVIDANVVNIGYYRIGGNIWFAFRRRGITMNRSQTDRLALPQTS